MSNYCYDILPAYYFLRRNYLLIALSSILILHYEIGTDSRLGVGFSLGEHADFQILVELGPQTQTEPIGNDNNDSKRRRAVSSLKSFANQFYLLQLSTN